MSDQISKQTKSELLEVLRLRYQHAAKIDKTKVLDEFVAVAGCHRKHAIRLLTGARREPTDANATKVGGWQRGDLQTVELRQSEQMKRLRGSWPGQKTKSRRANRASSWID